MSRHLIDPEILPLLDLAPNLLLDDASINATREMLAVAAAAAPPPALNPELRHARVGVGSPEVPVLIFDPPGRRHRAAVLQIHGGGMVLGTASWCSNDNASLAQELGVLVVSVDYRLAPEHPFPNPQTDCFTAYEWLLLNADALGVDRDRIAVCGESAGGGLAASVVHMARDKELTLPCLQVLTYPMLDCRTGSATRPGMPGTGEYIFTRSMNVYCWQALRGSYGCDDAYAGWFSPSLAKSFSGLSPAFIATGALDLFLDEDIEYARRLAEAGVPVELHVYPGAVHAFDKLPDATVSRQFTRDRRAALRRALCTTD